MDDETAQLSAELHAQLAEQVHSLAEVEEALAADPGDTGLLELQQQLEQGIVHLRDSLQAITEGCHEAPQQHAPQAAAAAAAPTPQPAPAWVVPGARCRFRHSDGRWHPGVVQGVEQQQPPQQAALVTLHFAYPTRCVSALATLRRERAQVCGSARQAWAHSWCCNCIADGAALAQPSTCTCLPLSCMTATTGRTCWSHCSFPLAW